MIDAPRTATAIAWSRLVAVAAMQCAIILGWVMYRLYLPELFAEVGLSASVVGTVLFFEVAIAFFLEPLMGYGSDRLRIWLGSRFPLVLAGVLLAVLMFVLLPAATGLSAIARQVLPMLAVIWAMGMAMFRSPVLVLLGQCARPSELPYAAAVLMAVGTFAGKVIPLANGVWLSYGVEFTFAIGSLVLLLCTVAIRMTLPSAPTLGAMSPSPSLRPLAIALLRTIAVAVGVTGVGTMVGAVVSRGSETAWLSDRPLQVGLVAAACCLLSGAMGKRWGMRQMATGAAGVAVAALLGLAVTPVGTMAVALMVAIVACQSAIAVGTIPLALAVAPSGFGGMTIGMYFGSLGLAGQMWKRLLTGGLAEASAVGFAQVGVVALILVGLGFGWGLWRSPVGSPE